MHRNTDLKHLVDFDSYTDQETKPNPNYFIDKQYKYSYSDLEAEYKQWMKSYPSWRGDFAAWLTMRLSQALEVIEEFDRLELDVITNVRKKIKTCRFCGCETYSLSQSLEAHNFPCSWFDLLFTIARMNHVKDYQFGRRK